jgi:6-phosphogluconolactonase
MNKYYKPLIQLFVIITFCCPIILNAQQYYMLVGTYTNNSSSKGIYVYKWDVEKNTIDSVGMAAIDNPSFLTFSKNGKYVYSVTEDSKKENSAVASFNFDNKTGKLTPINSVKIDAAGPCYITVDKTNNWLFTANYGGGSITLLPLRDDGSIESFKMGVQYYGKSINSGRQQAPHAHSIEFTPDYRQLFVPDLGSDKVRIYQFLAEAKPLPFGAGKDSIIISRPGSGPRHITFHPNRKIFCVINELSGTIDVFDYSYSDAEKTQSFLPKLIQTISTDGEMKNDKGSADIHFSNDGKFLYATNRGNYNSISTFSFSNKTSELSLVDVQSTLGKHPRNFMVENNDNFVVVANQNTNDIVFFKRNKSTGKLTPTDLKINIGKPSCLKLINAKK